jgi:hypothetical protein
VAEAGGFLESSSRLDSGNIETLVSKQRKKKKNPKENFML